jgi:radical SAM-linked protein
VDDGPGRRVEQAEAPPEARQRWRVTFRRDSSAEPLAQRDYVESWERGVLASRLPILVGSGAKPRPRLAFAAPLPVGMVAEHEIADLFLTAKVPVPVVREGLERHLPEGHQLLDVHDVWLGEPGLQAQVSAADYRVTLADDAPSAEQLRGAARRLLAAETLPRSRDKGGGPVAYDLRPLLGDVVVLDGTGPTTLRIRTMFHVERGTGRPEEVMAALGEELGHEIRATQIVRERVILDDHRPQPAVVAKGPGGPRRRPSDGRRRGPG